ncbi:hypothetical protein RFI_00842 [Reticulomyxa filosa]|uniref:Phytanoyl-CoA dioxygenase n=1 Tax=Reticulomyxa filosa TaxID=46433 RepID=X6PCG5_RETFI|nr:hypothetical protein RFI_00842 [Reticulomyxa filosa]|eukprot:ETO36220.1 hypothetical protein RFI_00842 [Reticulomyxa filosa]
MSKDTQPPWLQNIIKQAEAQARKQVTDHINKQIQDQIQLLGGSADDTVDDVVGNKIAENYDEKWMELFNLQGSKNDIIIPQRSIFSKNEDKFGYVNGVITLEGYHTIITSMKTRANVLVLPSGHIIAKGGTGVYSRFNLRWVQYNFYTYVYVYAHTKRKKGAIDLVTIQNINTQKYMSMSESGKVQCLDSASHESTHFKMVKLTKKRSKESQKTEESTWYAFEGVTNRQRRLHVNDKGLVQSVQSLNDESETEVGCCFTIANVKARSFPLAEQGSNIFMTHLAKGIHEGCHKREDVLSQSQNQSQSRSHRPMKGRKMTAKEKLHFYENGFVVIKDVVDKTILNTALKFVNRGIEKGSHCDGLGFFGMWDCDDCDVIIPGAQIALRFPMAGDTPTNLTGGEWHIDGMKLSNQVGICGFSVLCGFALSSWPDAFVGNFAVWPRKHFDMFTIVQSMGGTEPFLDKVRQSLDETPCIWEAPPKQIQAEPGDIEFCSRHCKTKKNINKGDFICCHPLLPHRASPNYSPHIRYAVFMRPTRVDHALHRLAMTESDMWIEFKGLAGIQKTQIVSSQNHGKNSLTVVAAKKGEKVTSVQDKQSCTPTSNNKQQTKNLPCSYHV